MKPLRRSNASSARPRSSLARIGQAPKLDRRLVGIAGNREEGFEHRALLRFDRLARPQRRLLEEAVGDLAGAAPADRIDAGDRQQILDQRLGAGVVGAFQRRQHARLGERALARADRRWPQGRARARRRGADAGARRPAARANASTPSNRPASPSRAASGPPPAAAAASMREREDFRVGGLGVLAAEALEPGLRASRRPGRPARGKPGRDRNIPRSRRPCPRRDRRGRRGSYIPASGKAPRPRRRRSGTGGRGFPRPTCRERSPPDGGSAARCARSRRRGNGRARARRRCAAPGSRDRQGSAHEGSAFTGWSSKSCGASFNKAARRAQPFSRCKVNRQSAPRFAVAATARPWSDARGARRRITLDGHLACDEASVRLAPFALGRSRARPVRRSDAPRRRTRIRSISTRRARR